MTEEYRRVGNEGVLAGILGCAFGVLAIFTIGTIFVPLAALCTLVGMVRGINSTSYWGIAASLIGAILTIVGFVVSTSVWATAAHYTAN